MEARNDNRSSVREVRHRNPRGQGERLRDEILEAADALLADSRDARQLSLRGVAKRVGIAATSVYLHFPDIEHLKIALVMRGFAELDLARDEASRSIRDPLAALLARLRAYAAFALAHPGRYRLMFGPDLPPNLSYDEAESPGRRAFQALVEGIVRCQDAGVTPREDDPTRLATEVWAALHGLVVLRLDRPGFPWPPLEGLVDETVTRLLGCEKRVDSNCTPNNDRQ